MEKLDREILDWIVQYNADDALIAQLRCADVVKRDYMRTGFFVYLSAARDAPDIAAPLRVKAPDIASNELLDGGGTSLFLRGGRIHYLEIYAKGGFFPVQLQSWQLVQPG